MRGWRGAGRRAVMVTVSRPLGGAHVRTLALYVELCGRPRRIHGRSCTDQPGLRELTTLSNQTSAGDARVPAVLHMYFGGRNDSGARRTCALQPGQIWLALSMQTRIALNMY